MLDWLFALLIILAFLMIMLAIVFRDSDEPFWNIVLIAISATLWFVLALFNAGGIETAYTFYNVTTGTTELQYDVYATEPMLYLTYFFGLMGVLCFIYLIVTIFGYYYAKVDAELNQQEQEIW